MGTLKPSQIGSSVGAVRPNEPETERGFGEADEHAAVASSADREFALHMEVARQVMRRWRGVLRTLAKE